MASDSEDETASNDDLQDSRRRQLQGLCLAAEFSFQIDIFNYSLPPWPPAAVLSPSEDTSEALASDLKMQKLLQARQASFWDNLLVAWHLGEVARGIACHVIP